MTVKEAKASLARWKRFQTNVEKRWRADSPLVELAQRRAQEAGLRVFLYQRVEAQLQAIKKDALL